MQGFLKRIGVALLGLSAGVAGLMPAAAQVSSIDITTQPTSEGVVYQFFIDFAGQYTGAQLIVELTSGSIYQDAVGSATPPNAAFIPVFPSLANDSFVAQGSAVAGGPFGEPLPGGGAVDLGGAAAAQFDVAGINQAWNPAGGEVITDQVGFLIAQITLSTDAVGDWSLLASAGGDITTVGGIFPFPEPTSAAFLGLGGLALLRRRLTRSRVC